MKCILIGFILVIVAALSASIPVVHITNAAVSRTQEQKTVLSEHKLDLTNRYKNIFVNNVFKDNILLNLSYMARKTTKTSEINWSEIRKPYEYSFVLNPGEGFAFHDDLLSEYRGEIVKTTNAHFDASEGFLTDGLLYGDGVCHFASLINWVASDAGLTVVSKVNHNFANIPGVPMKYGTSIYASPGASARDQMQNLYVVNNQKEPVYFSFTADGKNITLKIYTKE